MISPRPQTASSLHKCHFDLKIHQKYPKTGPKGAETKPESHVRFRLASPKPKYPQSCCLLTDLMDSERKTLEHELLVAAEKGDYKSAYLILHQGVDTKNCRGLQGFTPLHHAAARGHLEIIRLLLEFNWDVDIRNDTFETALHLACFHNYYTIAEYLINQRADMNASTVDMETPLFYATRKNCKQIVRLLIRRECDVFLKNRYGDTAEAEADDSDMEREFTQGKKDLKHSKFLGSSGAELKLTIKLREQILAYLDLKSLCRALQVSYRWSRAADAVFLWKHLGVCRSEMQLATCMGVGKLSFQRWSIARRPFSEESGMSRNRNISSALFMREI